MKPLGHFSDCVLHRILRILWILGVFLGLKVRI